jgi:hypothetical protein
VTRRPAQASGVIADGAPTGEVLIAPEPLIGLTAESCLKRKTWTAIRQQVLVDAEFQCIDCGVALPDRRNLHAHEVWEFDDDQQKAVLGGIRCVCAACHAAIHAPPGAGPNSGGFAAWRAYGEEHAWAKRLVETRERRSRIGWMIEVRDTLARQWPELAVLDGLITLPGMGELRQRVKREYGRQLRGFVFEGEPTPDKALQLHGLVAELVPNGNSIPGLAWDRPGYLGLWRPGATLPMSEHRKLNRS